MYLLKWDGRGVRREKAFGKDHSERRSISVWIQQSTESPSTRCFEREGGLPFQVQPSSGENKERHGGPTPGSVSRTRDTPWSLNRRLAEVSEVLRHREFSAKIRPTP